MDEHRYFLSIDVYLGLFMERYCEQLHFKAKFI